jgi:hypothetical protein
MGCFLAAFAPEGYVACDGRTDRVHLIPQQLLRREGHFDEIWNEALWVPGCRKHHGLMDVSRRLRIPRCAIPLRTSIWAERHGLDWYLDREYGAGVSVLNGQPMEGEAGTDAQGQ